MAIKKTNVMVFCPMCNCESESVNFYESQNPHDGCEFNKDGSVKKIGYVRYCKKDIAKCYLDYLKKGTMQSAVYFTCALTDTPFIKEVWDRYIELRNEKIKSGKITPTQLKTYNDFAKYREQLKAMKKATDDWNDFSATNVDYRDIMGLKKSDIALEAEKDKFVLDWGKRENIQDYQYLEYEYGRLTKDKPLKPQEETLYRKLCMVELMIRLKEEKDEPTSTEQTQLLNLMKTLKIDNFQEEKDKSTIEEIIEKQIWEVENTEPCEIIDREYWKDYCDIGKNWGKEIIRAVKNLITGSREFPNIESYDKKKEE
jgi:hypothetical protein